MPYIITKVGTALKLVDSAGETKFFSNPSFSILPVKYPTVPVACVEVRQGELSVQLTNSASGSNVTSVNGVAIATIGVTAALLFDALVAVPSGNLTAQTSATGATYVPFGSQACSSLTIFNGTGTAIDVQQGGAGAAVSIPAATLFTFAGITNASQLAVRRTDVSNTQVTVGARYQA